MKKIKLLLVACLVGVGLWTHAQVYSVYSHSLTTGTATDMTGATVIWEGQRVYHMTCFYKSADTVASYTGAVTNVQGFALPENFGFKFNGFCPTNFVVYGNGVIGLGTKSGIDVKCALSSPLQEVDGVKNQIGFAAVMGMIEQGASDTKISYKTTGTAPDRVFTVEFYKIPQKSTALLRLVADTNVPCKLQIRLYEANNNVECYFYKYQTAAAAASNMNFGLKGSAWAGGDGYYLTGSGSTFLGSGVNAAQAGSTLPYISSNSAPDNAVVAFTFTRAACAATNATLAAPATPVNLKMANSITWNAPIVTPAGVDPIAPDGMVVLITEGAAAPTVAPVDGMNYAPGDVIGNATVRYAGPIANFTTEGLTPSTAYTATCYMMNNMCKGATKYNTTSICSMQGSSKFSQPQSITVIGQTATELIVDVKADKSGMPFIIAMATQMNSQNKVSDRFPYNWTNTLTPIWASNPADKILYKVGDILGNADRYGKIVASGGRDTVIRIPMGSYTYGAFRAWSYNPADTTYSADFVEFSGITEAAEEFYETFQHTLLNSTTIKNWTLTNVTAGKGQTTTEDAVSPKQSHTMFGMRVGSDPALDISENKPSFETPWITLKNTSRHMIMANLFIGKTYNTALENFGPRDTIWFEITEDGSNYTKVASLQGLPGTTWNATYPYNQLKAVFKGYAGKRIKIKMTWDIRSENSIAYAFSRFAVVQDNDPCGTPNPGALTNLTQSSVKMNWTKGTGNETQWNVRYAEYGTENWSKPVNVKTSNNYTFNNLPSSVPLKFQVQAVCDGGIKSAWMLIRDRIISGGASLPFKENFTNEKWGANGWSGNLAIDNNAANAWKHYVSVAYVSSGNFTLSTQASTASTSGGHTYIGDSRFRGTSTTDPVGVFLLKSASTATNGANLNAMLCTPLLVFRGSDEPMGNTKVTLDLQFGKTASYAVQTASGITSSPAGGFGIYVSNNTALGSNPVFNASGALFATNTIGATSNPAAGTINKFIDNSATNPVVSYIVPAAYASGNRSIGIYTGVYNSASAWFLSSVAIEPTCPAILDITEGDVTINSAAITWRDNSTSNEWLVEVAKAGEAWTRNFTVEATKAKTFSGLDARTDYKARITRVCAAGDTAPVKIIEFTTPGAVCDAPTALNITDTAKKSATLNWTASATTTVEAPELYYNARYKDVNSTEWNDLEGLDATATNVPLINLLPGISYQYQMKTVCSKSSKDTSTWTAVQVFQSFPSFCYQPYAIKTDSIGRRGVKLSFTDSTSEARYPLTNRKYQYSVTTNATVTGNTFATDTVFAVGSLTMNTTYLVRMRAICAESGEMEADTSAWISAGDAYEFKTLNRPVCGTPTGVNVDSLGFNLARVKWTKGAYNIKFDVKCQKDQNPATDTVFDFKGRTDTVATFIPLKSDTLYVCTITPICDDEGTTYTGTAAVSAGFRPLSTACAPPRNLGVTYNSFHEAGVRWRSGLNIEAANPTVSYDLSYYKVSDSANTARKVTVAGNGTEASYVYDTIRDLLGLSTYKWSVVSNCELGTKSAPVISVTDVVTKDTTCYAPTALTEDSIRTRSVKVSWTKGAGETPNTSWAIQYNKSGEAPQTISSITDTFYTITGLTPEEDYEWTVMANCQFSSSDYVTVKSTFTTLDTTCVAPTNPVAANASYRTVDLSWTPDVTNVSWEVVYTLTGGADQTQAAATSAYQLAGLRPTSTYSWKVRAICEEANSDYVVAPATFTTLDSTCVAPTNPVAANASYRTVDLSWTPDATNVSWEVVYTLTGGADQTQDASTEEFELTGLRPNSTYSWKVRGVCADANSDYVDAAATFTTLDTICNTPTALAVTDITVNGANLVWSSANTYTDETFNVAIADNIAIFSNPNPQPTDFVEVANNLPTESYTANALDANTRYYWSVTAVCGAAGSTATAVLTEGFTTLPGNSINEGFAKGLKVYAYNGQIFVVNKDNQYIANVEVLNNAGQMVVAKSVKNNGDVTVDTPVRDNVLTVVVYGADNKYATFKLLVK